MNPDKRLVIDIGGGSTEVVIGEGFNPLLLESLSVGCVGLSAFFRRRPNFREALRARANRGEARTRADSGSLSQARLAAGLRQLRHGARHRRRRAPAESRCAAHHAGESANALAERVIAAGHVDDLDLADVDAERAPVFPAGSRSCWKSSRTSASIGSASPRARCARGCSTTSWAGSPMRMRAYAACAPWRSAITSMRCRPTASRRPRSRCSQQVESEWGLEDPLAESALRWAARLHETGLDIAHSKYHRHSAYLLEHADMPGFPREEQLLLAALVGGHRRQLSFEALEDLVPPWDRHGGIPDRAAAPGGAAASRPQSAAAAGSASAASRAGI